MVVALIACGVIASGYGAWRWNDQRHMVRIVISDSNTHLPDMIILIRGQRDTLVINNQS
jgi:uncharacterized membrane protein YidH (DUF202 family)